MRKISEHNELYGILNDLCENQRSGSLLMFTEDGAGAGIALDHGRITSIGYKQFRGMIALDLMQDRSVASCEFKQDVNVFLGDAMRGNDVLPDTHSVLDYLKEN